MLMMNSWWIRKWLHFSRIRTWIVFVLLLNDLTLSINSVYRNQLDFSAGIRSKCHGASLSDLFSHSRVYFSPPCDLLCLLVHAQIEWWGQKAAVQWGSEHSDPNTSVLLTCYLHSEARRGPSNKQNIIRLNFSSFPAQTEKKGSSGWIDPDQ